MNKIAAYLCPLLVRFWPFISLYKLFIQYGNYKFVIYFFPYFFLTWLIVFWHLTNVLNFYLIKYTNHFPFCFWIGGIIRKDFPHL